MDNYRKAEMPHSKSIQKYVKQIPEDTHIWRYLTAEKLLWMLRDEAVYFCQIKRFEDENEGDIFSFSDPNLIPLGSDLYERYQKDKDAPNFIRSYCGVSCWHINDNFSPEMWNDYTDKTGGAAIQTTVGKLQKYVGHTTEYGKVEYGMVEYSGTLPLPPPGDQDGMSPSDVVMFHKKPEPKYVREQEYRAILFAVSNHPRSMSMMNHYGGLNVKVDLEDLIEVLYLPEDQPFTTKIVIDNLIQASGLNLNIKYI